MSEQERNFGITTKGPAKLYILRSGHCEAAVTDFGATLVSFIVRDGNGKATDVVLGYDDAPGYEKGGDFFGATVGRNANRISGAAFELNGRTYRLQKNENDNNHHSGPDVYAKRIFQTDGVEDGHKITFRLDTPDGDQGFPGNMRFEVTYTLSEDGSLELAYHAETDQDTVCNPTNHSYFNLNGQGSPDILSTILQIDADRFTPIRDDCIPTGELRSVDGTPYDFRKPKEIGKDIGEVSYDQIQTANGYDQNFCLDDRKGTFRKAAEAYSPLNHVKLEVFTDLPGLQFYTGNFIQVQKGKGGADYGPRSGFALESQYYPNGINEPAFPTPVLKAGESFDSRTVYRLSISPR